jgi:hypothetical protein
VDSLFRVNFLKFKVDTRKKLWKVGMRGKATSVCRGRRKRHSGEMLMKKECKRGQKSQVLIILGSFLGEVHQSIN